MNKFNKKKEKKNIFFKKDQITQKQYIKILKTKQNRNTFYGLFT